MSERERERERKRERERMDAMEPSLAVSCDGSIASLEPSIHPYC